jgi:hypothetical protein
VAPAKAGKSMMLRRVTLGVGTVLWLFAVSICHGQSLDPDKPAPLGAGANKGYIDNSSGVHYYYFWAEPGHIDIRMTFKETGIFGVPWPQELSFDFLDESRKLIFHNAIKSWANMEQITTPVDIKSRRKVILAITAQGGLVRLGGDYEVQITGSVRFEGSPGATTGVKPQGTELALPGQLVQPGGALISPKSRAPSAAQMSMEPWLTHSADNSRSGWNPHERQLTQAAIATKGLVRTTIIPVIGDVRGMEAQPLILPNVKTALGTRDVLVLPSMADVVRGVDAHDGSGIWQVTLGVAVTGSKNIDFHQINQFWGCLSTGVIDPDTQRLYQVCWVSPDKSGDPKTARYYMFVLNMANGSEIVPPVLIEGKSGNQDFNAGMRKQRSALVETNANGVKTVFGCAGTVFETQSGASGYCFAFDVASNKLSAMLALSAGEGAGVWMAGQGPAADAQGFLYLTTGNGDFDGATQWGESFLKLQYTPASGNAAATFKVVDHWTPWTDFARTGQKPEAGVRPSGVSAPSEALMQSAGGVNMPLKNARLVPEINDRGKPLNLVFPEMAQSAWGDEDFGSAGPACIFSIGVCIAGGKDGIAYPIKTEYLGGTTVADLANPKANCAKLAVPPVWLTMSPGPVDPCPTDPRTLNFFPEGHTAHLHMTPVQFFDPTLNSWTLFAWGDNSHLRKWKVSSIVSSTGALAYVAESHEYASDSVREKPPGGMPGGFCSGSSDGADPDSALLFCTIPYGDANADVVNGRFLVYDPVHLAPDGSLKVLWDSQRWNVQFVFNKFDPPVVDGGQIYVPNYNGGVDLYRLVQ